ncbi:MAG: hypothetical protein CVU89_11480 [Firmicutes bacterium HGW-Firmicutes-14]|nr:MAG: hypothetical protein CVU89_11480 [Firmicutes bacterium HGW-Firmicutes-14]
MPSWKDLDDLAKSFNIEREYEKLNVGIDFASKLIRARQKLNLTQTELAKRAGLKQSAIARIENSGNIPRLDTVYKIAKALKCNFDFCSFDSDLSEEHNLHLGKIVDKISNLETTLKELVKEVSSLKKQGKRPIYLVSHDKTSDIPKTEISPFDKIKLEEAQIYYLSPKGVDDYDRWNQ